MSKLKVIKEKIMGMYTDPNHIKIEDPGQIEGNIVFTYLDAFSCDDDFKKYLPEYKNLDDLKAHYKQGGVGDMKIKKFLYTILENLLTPVREKRAYYESRIDVIKEYLKEGTEKANKLADQTLKEVKDAIGINYFN